MPAPPEVLTRLCERFDAPAFDAPSDRARLRLAVDEAGEWDFVVNGSARDLEPAEEKLRPDARLSADRAIAFARHVREALPAALHVELGCGHVPQLEAPKETHAAVRRFLAVSAGRAAA
jgi:pimeloyl-ACP methyl ester carboxylesterase